MANTPRDAIEIDALLTPTLGDTSRVEKLLNNALSKAAKPLVDTLTNTKVGLNEQSLRRAQRQLEQLSREFSESFDQGIGKVLSAQGKDLRTAAGLKELSKSDAGVAKMVKILGGYEQASNLLSRADANDKLGNISRAFKQMNDVAFQVSKLPAISDDTQKLLSKLYKGNTADGFRKLTQAQQKQVKDALAIVDLQDKAFGSLQRTLLRAGLGTAATDITKSLKGRRQNAQRLNAVSSPEALERLQRNEERDRQNLERKRARLEAQAARSQALSEEKDRTLKRTKGIQGLRDKQDIDVVRGGLNRDFNLATQRAALARRGTGGMNSQSYREASAQIDVVKRQRDELNALVSQQKQLASTNTSQQRAENKQLADRAAQQESYNNSQRRAEEKQLEAQARYQKSEQKARDKEVASAGGTARNQFQARAIIRNSGGDFSELSKTDVATVRPYLQDRFKARSAFAETVATKYGTDSPEYSKAASSAREYADALEKLNGRAKELRPQISDLGQVVRSFFRYALGYGALYEMLGGVSALTKGLLDLDEQFYNIQAITLSTDSQMKTIEGSIKQVGMSTKFTLNEVAKAAQVLAQAGTAPEKIPGQLKATADFAAATGTSLESAADLLTSFENVYTSISDGKAADMLTKALNLSKLQGDDLKTIVSYTAQTADSYNVSAEQLLGAVSTLRNVGIKPSTIATGLRQAMLEVFNPDTKLTKALQERYKQMGESMDPTAIGAKFNAFTFADNPLVSAVSELKRLGFGGEASNLFSRAFDVRAFNPLQALVNNFDQFNSLSSQIGVGRSASEASEIQLKSLRATMENLGAATIAFADSIGGDMVRSLQHAGEEATNLVQKLTELDTAMKAGGGAGLVDTITNGALGAGVGALLAGKGLTRRLAGAATGAYVAGGVTQASNTEGSGASDYALPAIAGLLTIAPALMDFVGGLRGRSAEIKAMASASKGIAKVDVGPALNAGAAVVDVVSSLANAKMPSGLRGLGAAGIARLGAGLVARAIPFIGLIYTAYEILSMFSEDGTNKVQGMIDAQTSKAGAAGDLYRSQQAKYDKAQGEITEYKVDDYGSAKEGTTASTALKLRKEADNLQMSLGETFGAAATQLGAADDLLRDYAKRDSQQRKGDLDKIQALTGKRLTDSQAYDISTQMEQLDKGIDGFRDSLLQIVNRSTDSLREAIAKGDKEGIEKAGAMNRVLDSMPELQQYIYGQIPLAADKATALFLEFNKRMATEIERGSVDAAKVLETKVTAAAEDIAAVGAQLGQSGAVDNAIQQIITGITITEKNTVDALNQLAAKVRAKAAELYAQADKMAADATADQNAADFAGGAVGIAGFGDAEGMSGFLQERYQKAADKKRAQAQNARDQGDAETKAGDAAAARAVQQQQADDLAKQAARAASSEVQNRISEALGKSTFTDAGFTATLSADQRALLNQMKDPTQRAALAGSNALDPRQVRTGQYQQSPAVAELEKILRANQQYLGAQATQSKQKASEAAKAQYLSDPEVQVQIAKLQNDVKAAQRNNDFPGAQAATKKIYDLQYGEQAKAVKRAEIAMNEAKADPKKDATSAIEKYSSERAKLESLRGDMAEKVDEFQKKMDDLDIKRRTVETTVRKNATQKEFTEAINRGDVEGATKASKEYAVVQAELIELARKELAQKGYSADQIELEISSREELTKTLIDQESAQKTLTQAIISRADFMMRDVGTGPTTGNKGVDSYLSETGIGFTDYQRGRAYDRDLGQLQQSRQYLTQNYQAQRAQMTDPDLVRSTDQSYTAALEKIDAKIGETAAKAKQLKNTFSDELAEGFNPTAILSGLQQSQNSLQNFGETVRGQVVSAFDSLGGSIANAVLESESLSDAIQGVIHQLANDVFTSGIKMGVNYLGQSAMSALTGDDGTGQNEATSASGVLSGLLGLNGGGGAQNVGTANIQAGAVYVNGAVAGAPAVPGIPGVAGVPGGDDGSLPDFLGIAPSGAGSRAPAAMAAPAAADPAAAQEGFFSSMGSMFGNLGTSISDTFSGLTSSLGSLFSGLFGGGGGSSGGKTNWLGTAAQLGMQYYTGNYAGMAQTTAGAAQGGKGYAEGGMPSRTIQGPMSAKRDNLMATATVGGKTVPIKVEANEGILSRNAMSAIGGERGLNMLNSGKMPRFSVGGAPDTGYNPGKPATSGQEMLATTMRQTASESAKQEINIANLYSDQAFSDFVTSRNGRKVLINTMKEDGAI